MADHRPRQVGPWIEDFQVFPRKGGERTEASKDCLCSPLSPAQS